MADILTSKAGDVSWQQKWQVLIIILSQKFPIDPNFKSGWYQPISASGFYNRSIELQFYFKFLIEMFYLNVDPCRSFSKSFSVTITSQITFSSLND